MDTQGTGPSLSEVTQNQQRTWSSGNFHEIGRQTIPMSEVLVNAVDPHAGQRVLDVACGSGNGALIAARRYCEVSGIDYVPELIDIARSRAKAEAVEIDFRVADAQELPYDDATFDVVISAIGVMFAPDQERAASELARVCKPGGVIGLASWMPEHFGGDFFAAHARYAPPPPGVAPPGRWGTEAGLQEMLGDRLSSISHERQSVDIMFARSVEHAMDVYRTYFGPTIRAFAMTSPDRHPQLWDDIASVLRRYDRAGDGTLIVEAQYLQSIGVRAL